MNTGLGLNFLRFVNEEGSNGWAQVYARIPFDDVELKTKGALLGAVFGKEKKDWADIDAELMTWVDQYFNGLDKGESLTAFFCDFRSKYPGLMGIWIWIVLGKDGTRELKLIRLGEAGGTLVRNGKEFSLATNLEEGKVIRGKLEEGDNLILWTSSPPEKEEAVDDEEFVVKWSGLLKERERASSGLLLQIDRLEKGVEVASQEEIVPEPYETKQHDEPELVGDHFVGPIGLKEKLWNVWRQRGSRQLSGVVIKRDISRRKKWAGFLGFSFLFLLIVSIVVGSFKMNGEAEVKRWRNFSEPMEKSIQEAIDLSKINPSGAKRIMEEVKADFEAQKTNFAKGKYKKDLADLEKKITDGWVVTSGEKESQVEEVINLELVRPGFKGERLSLVKASQFLVLDKTMGVVVTAETKMKDVKVVAGKGEGDGWVDISGDGKNILIMNKVGIGVAGEKQQTITFDNAVMEPVAMGRFSGNVYVLDKGNKEIFKYGGLSEGYGSRSRWLKQDQTISINPVDVAIDSDIWIVGENGQVEKYRRGAKEQFAVSGLPTGIRVSRLAVELSGDKLALLDSGSGMVVICSKENGNCTQQLKSEKLRQATDIEFDESGDLLVLLQGTVGILR